MKEVCSGHFPLSYFEQFFFLYFEQKFWREMEQTNQIIWKISPGKPCRMECCATPWRLWRESRNLCNASAKRVTSRSVYGKRHMTSRHIPLRASSFQPVYIALLPLECSPLSLFVGIFSLFVTVLFEQLPHIETH